MTITIGIVLFSLACIVWCSLLTVWVWRAIGAIEHGLEFFILEGLIKDYHDDGSYKLDARRFRTVDGAVSAERFVTGVYRLHKRYYLRRMKEARGKEKGK